MTVAEQIYELVRALPEEKAAEVLTFAESIRAKQTSEKSAAADQMSDWHRFLDSIDPADWDDFPTLEEIRANQGEDAPREPW